jgi:hypothetical protein
MKFLVLILALYFTPAKQEKVLICKSGTAYAYHNYQCQGLKKCTHLIESVSLKEALALKRKPCEYCYDVKTSPASPSTNGQCAATTKKGTQCSRKGSSNGYCWQHSK